MRDIAGFAWCYAEPLINYLEAKLCGVVHKRAAHVMEPSAIVVDEV